MKEGKLRAQAFLYMIFFWRGDWTVEGIRKRYSSITVIKDAL